MVDALSALSITANLGTSIIGRRVVYTPILPSTMDAARREAQLGAEEGMVVVAGEQSAGRGRLGRTWLSPRGSICLSIVLYPDVPHLSALVMLASLAVVCSIKAVTGLPSGIKWPNDILVNGRKVSGILIESALRGRRADYAIIGIGLNANFDPADYPEMSTLATSLSRELGRDIAVLDVVRCLLIEADRLYVALREGRSLLAEWADNLVALGRPVRVTGEEIACEGVAESVDREGRLLVRQPDGTLLKVVAGDVTLRE